MQIEAGDDSFVTGLWDRALGVACRYPRNPPLRIRDDIRKPLRRDGEHPRRLGRWVGEVVQPTGPFGKVDDLSGQELLLAFRRAHRQCPAEDEEHLLDAV